eukprot:jgi/Ulvmu1/5249/UM022_0042.1
MLSAHPTMRSGTSLVVPCRRSTSTALIQRQPSTSALRKAFDPMRLSSSTVAKSFGSAVIGASTVDQMPIFQWLSYAIVTFAAYQLAQVQDEKPSGNVCPRCDGTGQESCACNRWSDGDSGCRSCNYTGTTQCKACRGGGTAVPISVAIRKDDPGHRNQ